MCGHAGWRTQKSHPAKDILRGPFGPWTNAPGPPERVGRGGEGAVVAGDLVLGIDCSTTASKAVLWDAVGAPVAEGRAPLALLAPHAGWGEQRADDW